MPNLGSDDAINEIRIIFETECNDGLDVIEAGLLQLEAGDDNLDIVNDIFRGAHSIKGGAATFGYANIADFTHVMETLLDKVRSEELAVTPPLVKVFLESVDSLRAMVETMDGGDYDVEKTELVKQRLSAWLDDPSSADNSSAPDTEVTITTDAPPTVLTWHIHFVPQLSFLLSGNQPQHIFRALAELGKVSLTADYSTLPEFSLYNPLDMYLSWDIELQADVSKERILEEFDWVETECQVEITEIKPVEKEESRALGEEQRAPEKLSGRRATDKKSGRKESGSIRVDIDKIDVVLNLVGEMVINQSMLNQFNSTKVKEGANDFDAELDQRLSLLERTTRELQEAVMKIRMLPVSTAFNRYPRLVYDLSSKLDKKVELLISGETTELDKTVLEKIGDPLLHLIRNSLDHGVESPEVRVASGKEETGIIHLSAAHEGGSVVIRVSDDGAGLNTEKIRRKAIDKGIIGKDDILTEQEVHDLVFRAGFSTADVVTDVSGRGVGMDVVRNNIEDIGGRVEVHSESGKGSTFQITLPLTLAILDGQLIKVSDQVYVIPLLSIVETVQLDLEKINTISGSEIVYRLRGEVIPVVDMRKLYKTEGAEDLVELTNKQLVIVESERKSVGLVVDSLLDQHQVVIKSLETNYMKTPGMLGATILGDGNVSLIVDVTTLTETAKRSNENQLLH